MLLTKEKIKKEISIRSLKLLDMLYLIVIYFILAIFIAFIMIKLGGSYDQKVDEEKTLFRLSVEIIIMIWLSLILGYILRNIVEKLPSPFDSIHGFEHNKLKELHSISSYAITIILLTSIYNTKFNYFTERLYRGIKRFL